MPGGSASILMEKVDALAPETRALLEMASVFGETMDLELLSHVSDVPPEQTYAAVRELSRHGLIDESNEDEIARYDLTGSGNHTAQIMAKVSRDGNGWSMTAIGATASGQTVRDLVPASAAHL